jgi:hypothetical protein
MAQAICLLLLRHLRKLLQRAPRCPDILYLRNPLRVIRLHYLPCSGKEDTNLKNPRKHLPVRQMLRHRRHRRNGVRPPPRPSL